jgi:LPXTG-motif cell wall-anchored protein
MRTLTRLLSGSVIAAAAVAGLTTTAFAATVTITPSNVSPSGTYTYTIADATCVPAGTGAGVFNWTLREGGPTGTIVSGPFVVQNDNFVGGSLTSGSIAAPPAGSYTIVIVGINACTGTDAQGSFTVGTPATTTTVAPTTTAAPTTATPTTVAPTTVPATAAPTTAPATTVAPTTTRAVTAPTLPATGRDDSALAFAAIAMLMAGGGLVAATRRR